MKILMKTLIRVAIKTLIKMITPLFLIANLFTIAVLSGCAASKVNTTPTAVNAPAIRINITADSQKELQQIISSSLHLSNVTLSNKALTQKSTVIIEKKRLTGFDLSTPTVFRLLKHRNQCIIINQKTMQRYPLAKTQCKVL